MLLIHTGNGKGKTTASIGVAIRALGQNMRVGFGQFMKRDNQAGEQHILKQLLNENFHAFGLGFFTREEDRKLHTEAARNLLDWALSRMEDFDLLVLDEALYALGYGLISQEELQAVIGKAASANTHLVLSGRGLPEWLREQADTVTEMTEIQHAYQKGRPATPGIEY
ncbi:cob(I)yrinic acid a,c-diamide adenosyltransferase [Oleidesulfovibrio sp.]|uniref:cob(I)yrinic acid a,c-diamide adenosyltransferase n=1 Tax=Oleidesulfovibrio sp. TaxID=2909707 RepID=UPI003A8AC586